MPGKFVVPAVLVIMVTPDSLDQHPQSPILHLTYTTPIYTMHSHSL